MGLGAEGSGASAWRSRMQANIAAGLTIDTPIRSRAAAPPRAAVWINRPPPPHAASLALPLVRPHGASEPRRRML